MRFLNYLHVTLIAASAAVPANGYGSASLRCAECQLVAKGIVESATLSNSRTDCIEYAWRGSVLMMTDGIGRQLCRALEKGSTVLEGCRQVMLCDIDDDPELSAQQATDSLLRGNGNNDSGNNDNNDNEPTKEPCHEGSMAAAGLLQDLEPSGITSPQSTAADITPSTASIQIWAAGAIGFVLCSVVSAALIVVYLRKRRLQRLYDEENDDDDDDGDDDDEIDSKDSGVSLAFSCASATSDYYRVSLPRSPKEPEETIVI